MAKWIMPLVALWIFVSTFVPGFANGGKSIMGEKTGKSPELISSMVQFQSNGDTISAFLCRPKEDVPYPAILLIHEIFGLNNHMKDVASRLAQLGYAVLVVDLWSREGYSNKDMDLQAMRKIVEGIPDQRILQDLKAGIKNLKGWNFVNKDRIGVIGFCMGGLYTILLAGQNKDLKAAVAFYGRIVYKETSEKKPISPIEVVKGISCPLLGLYGEADTAIPLQDVDLLKKTLEKYKKTYEISTYPGAGHAFFNDTRESYRPEAAKDAWERTVRFFLKNI